MPYVRLEYSPLVFCVGGLRVFCDFLWIWILKARVGHLGIFINQGKWTFVFYIICLFLFLKFN